MLLCLAMVLSLLCPTGVMGEEAHLPHAMIEEQSAAEVTIEETHLPVVTIEELGTADIVIEEANLPVEMIEEQNAADIVIEEANPTVAAIAEQDLTGQEGEEVNPAENTCDVHQAKCTNPGVCIHCGFEGEIENIVHNALRFQVCDGSYHQDVCDSCGYESAKYEHIAYCSNPKRCVECGYVGEQDLACIYHDLRLQSVDGSYHANVCVSCGYTEGESKHVVICSNPTECIECDYVGEIVDLIHTELRRQSIDDECHAYVCITCGYKEDFAAHCSLCTDKTVCEGCGYEGDMETRHTGGEEYRQNNSDTHLVVCKGCGETLREENHFALECTDPCQNCGYEGPIVEAAMHVGEETYVANGDKHDRICNDCGKVLGADYHSTTCLDPTHCQVCGYTGEIRYVYCDAEEEYVPNGEMHVLRCSACLRVKGEDPHHAKCTNPNVCSACGYEGEMKIEHASNVIFNPYKGEAEGHGRLCDDCGKLCYMEPHAGRCDNPNVCYVCGWEGEFATVDHNWHYKSIDEKTHQKYCGWCGIEGETGEHRADCMEPPAYRYCLDCGYQGEILNLRHDGKKCVSISDTMHEVRCSGCNMKFGEGAHIADCSDPTTCRECDYEGAIEDVRHGNFTMKSIDDFNHASVCDTCGYRESESSHYAKCNGTKLCEECGYAVKTENLTHSSESVYKSVDENEHASVCADCGHAYYTLPHRADCTQPDTCVDCGYVGQIEEILHGSTHTEYDRNRHWFICDECSEKLWEDVHYANCDDPEVCEECGAKDGILIYEVWHPYSENYTYNDQTHQRICEECGALEAPEKHRQNCLTPGKCLCGYEGEIEEILHNYDNDEFTYDEAGHQRVCNNCGEPAEAEAHWAYCTRPGKCECGYEGEIRNLQHLETDYVDCGDTHQVVCRDCEAILWGGQHFAECIRPNVCVLCGHEGEMEIVDHERLEYTITDEGHTAKCVSCGEIAIEGSHVASCNARGKCVECGYEGEIELIAHDFYKYTRTAEKHVSICRYCDETTEGTHYAHCSAPEVCVECGYEGEIEDVIHVDRRFTDLGDVHRVDCGACGATDEGEHWAFCNGDGTCVLCGSKQISYTQHFWSESSHNAETHDLTCTECGEIFNYFSELEVLDPTCTDDGYRAFTCAVCNQSGRTVLPALGHKWGEATIVTEATCAAEGTSERTCTVCNAVEKTVLPKVDHKWGEATVIEATCAAEGSSERTCTVCDAVEKTVLPKVDHKWGEATVIEATCAAEGTSERTCTVCNAVEKTVLSKADHKWGEATVTEATCAAEGTSERTCTVCNEVEKTVLPKVDHKWSEATIVEAGCASEGTSEKTCTICGAIEKKLLPVLGHEWREIARENATCTAGGSSHSECRRCGKQSVQELGALGHDFGVVYTSQNDGTHAVFCSRCNEKRAAKCGMVSIEIGDMICSACAICGYTEYTMKDSALEALPGMDGVAVNARLERVENAKFERVAIENGEKAPAIDANLTLVVHKMTLEIQSELPESVQANVRAVLAVTLLNGAESIQPDGVIRLSIPCEEEELEGLKLMLLTEEGELVEVEYEVIEGELVFETDKIGVFLLVEDTAEEI